jgi:single-strand DNA-binding protein
MSNSINRVTLVGFVGKKPELFRTPDGLAVLKLSLATNESIPNGDGGWKTLTEWHTVVLFKTRAEGVAKIVDKGSHLYVEGKLRTSTWKDQNDIKHWKTEIVASNIILLSSAAERKSNSSPEEENPFPADSDTPF